MVAVTAVRLTLMVILAESECGCESSRNVYTGQVVYHSKNAFILPNSGSTVA